MKRFLQLNKNLIPSMAYTTQSRESKCIYEIHSIESITINQSKYIDSFN